MERDWEKIDAWLVAMHHTQGALKTVSEALGVPVHTLSRRRKLLAAVHHLEPLPKGRPMELTETELEKKVMALMPTKFTVAEIGALCGVSRQAAAYAIESARRKRDAVANQCKSCGGAGVVECHKCMNTNGSHFHVCLDCDGKYKT